MPYCTAEQTLNMVDFGAWVKARMEDKGLKPQDLSRESGLLYAYINRLINSGKTGKPILPEQETVSKIGESLHKLGALDDPADAEIFAGYIPEGFKVVKPVDTNEPPENFADWPAELQEALGYTQELPRETAAYIYQLWREQARAHFDIDKLRRDAEAQLIERQRLLDQGTGQG